MRQFCILLVIWNCITNVHVNVHVSVSVSIHVSAFQPSLSSLSLSASSLHALSRTNNQPRISNHYQYHHTPTILSLSNSNSNNENDNENENEKVSKRKRFLNLLNLRNNNNNNKTNNNNNKNNKQQKPTFDVTTIQELNDYFNDVNYNFRTNNKNNKNKTIDYDSLLASLVVKGDTQKIGSKPNQNENEDDTTHFVHPVQKILHDRRRHITQQREREQSNTTNTNTTIPDTNTTTTTIPKNDNHKVALVIEGGGMRGCVTAGMVTAIYYLGLEDTFDVLYGSSAGTIIAAYFNTRQLPYFGPEIYYDSLTTAEQQFIDSKRLLRSIGIGLLDPRLVKDVVMRPAFGKPVLNLNYLLVNTMQVNKPLDWDKFVQMQQTQPLKVVSSGLSLETQRSVVLDYENGGFSSIEELALAMRSSCLLPGIAGPIVNVQKEHVRNDSSSTTTTTKGGDEKYIVNNNINKKEYEPMADALIFEPLPYQTAIDEGATHVVMLRSRPDGTDVTGKTSIFEKLILHRFFRKKNKLQHIYNYMRQHGHKKLYAQQVIELNDASNDVNGTSTMMAIAIPPGSPEVPRLETGREAIFEGVRRGFARAYDCLVEDVNERGRGAIVARQCLPDEILEYDPSTIQSGTVSAFEYFLSEKAKIGEGYDELPKTLGQTAYEANLPR